MQKPLNLKCQNKDVAMYLQVGQEKIPICPQCWIGLAESNVEWDESGLKTENNS